VRLRPLVASLVLLVSCTSGDAPDDASRGTSSPPPLRRDFEFEPFPGSRWYGPDGEPVPDESNVVNAITGPDHCGWESGVMLHLAWPVGREAGDASETRQYLRDPSSVFPSDDLQATFDDDVVLPDGAEYTGYRTDFMELWLPPDDGAHAAYLVFADHVERWPRAGDTIACG
jgi:hypothetical protein